MADEAQYPREFEIYRLQALGDPPFWTLGEAHSRYDDGRPLMVVEGSNPPRWTIRFAVGGDQVKVKYYRDGRAPVREVRWERVRGVLRCRRMLDMFYPDGNPGIWRPYSQILTVERAVSSDGVVAVSLESPAGSDFQETSGGPLAGLGVAVPVFGEWEPLLSAAAPGSDERFGLASVDSALALWAESTGDASPVEGDGGWWRVPLAVSSITGVVLSDVQGRAGAEPDAVVLRRGLVRVLPLAWQRPGADDAAGAARVRGLAEQVQDDLDHTIGRSGPMDLSRGGGAYARALTALGVTRADYWDAPEGRAIVLVLAAGEAGAGAWAALQVVPAAFLTAGAADVPELGWDPAEFPRAEAEPPDDGAVDGGR